GEPASWAPRASPVARASPCLADCAAEGGRAGPREPPGGCVFELGLPGCSPDGTPAEAAEDPRMAATVEEDRHYAQLSLRRDVAEAQERPTRSSRPTTWTPTPRATRGRRRPWGAAPPAARAARAQKPRGRQPLPSTTVAPHGAGLLAAPP
ncbi:unnamed protein product, partial [Prorocentrum cordatum]